MGFEYPRLPTSAGYALVVYCCIVMTVCAFLVYSPVKFFRVLNFGRPLPLSRVLEKGWVQMAYRVAGILIFVTILRILIHAVHP